VVETVIDTDKSDYIDKQRRNPSADSVIKSEIYKKARLSLRSRAMIKFIPFLTNNGSKCQRKNVKCNIGHIPPSIERISSCFYFYLLVASGEIWTAHFKLYCLVFSCFLHDLAGPW